MTYTEGTGEGEVWTEQSGETYEPAYEPTEAYGAAYETAEAVPPAAPPEPTEAYGGGDDTAYAAVANPDERWDTAPVIDDLVERGWDSIKETAEDAWNWATGDDEPSGGGGGEGGAAADGNEGAEGAPPYYDPGAGGLPLGGLPDEVLCGEGACPVCSQDRQMSSGCVLEYGHSGEHQCGYGDVYSQGVSDIPPPPPLPKCRITCSTCGQTCMLTLGHDGVHGCGH